MFRLLEDWGCAPTTWWATRSASWWRRTSAGVLSLEDACALVAARGRLMGALPGGGAMVAVRPPRRRCARRSTGLEDRVALAAVNGPAAVVVSGDEDAVLELAEAFAEQGCKTKRLRVSHAFHSPRMDGMLAEFGRIAAGLTFSAPQIPIVSNLTGEPVSDEQVCDPEYWVRHVREPVRFHDGVRWLDGEGVESLLELGPDGVLSAMARDCLAGGRGRTAAAGRVVSAAAVQTVVVAAAQAVARRRWSYWRGRPRRDAGCGGAGAARRAPGGARVDERARAAVGAGRARRLGQGLRGVRRAAGEAPDLRLSSVAATGCSRPRRASETQPRPASTTPVTRCSTRRSRWPKGRGGCSRARSRSGALRGWPSTS